MSASWSVLRVIVTATLILLPLMLVALTLEPLERSPSRTGRNTQVVIDSPRDGPSTPDPAPPGS